MDEAQGNSDEELVARTQAGDPDAFDELVVRHSRHLYRLVYDMTSNHDDTNNLLQDVFAGAYRSMGQFQRRANFLFWIQSLAVDTTRNFLVIRGGRP